MRTAVKNKEPGKSPHASIPRGKLIVFRCIAIALPFLLFGLIEAGFRLFQGNDYDPYVNVSPFYFFSRTTSHGVEYAQILHKFAYEQHSVRFPVAKPPETIRIFCVGGSACAGWPLSAEQMFSTYLRKLLETALPNRKVEVINAAAHGFASYRIRGIFNELLELDPDAILVYTGNNEFLETRDYNTLGWFAGRLKTVQWLRSHFVKPKTQFTDDELKDVASVFYQKIKQQALNLRKDPEQFENVKAHYRYSIERMARGAKEKGVPVLLCTVPVNLRHWLPTVSNNNLEGQALDQWRQSFELGLKEYYSDRPSEGSVHMARAVELNPEHAESHFWLGCMLELTDPIRARQCYSKARDLDYNPFRAISAFNTSARRIASEYDNVHLVDLEDAFYQAATDAAPGFDLFLDYVHPNTKGHLLITKQVFDTIADRRVLPIPMDQISFPGEKLTYDKNGNPYDVDKDLGLQTKLFSLYVQNHQHISAIRKVRQLYSLISGKELGPGQEPPAIMGSKVIEGYKALYEYESLRRKQILGEALDPGAMEAAQEKLQAYYDKWFSYDKY